MNKELLCKIGIHDKEIAGNGLLCLNYIKRCLYNYKRIEENEKIATRRFFIDRDADNVYRNIYPRDRWGENRVVQDYVCLRCSKCFKNIEIEKAWIKEHVKIYLGDKENREIRKQMAEDLYRENCEEH